jgi:hypothetical protein
VLALNLPWLLLPVATVVRMARDHPFTELATAVTGERGRSAGRWSRGEIVTGGLVGKDHNQQA